MVANEDQVVRASITQRGIFFPRAWEHTTGLRFIHKNTLKRIRLKCYH